MADSAVTSKETYIISDKNSIPRPRAAVNVAGLYPQSNIARLEDFDPEYIEVLKVRFWAEVDKTEDPEACWEWMGSTDIDGYGRITIRSIQYRAHRLSYLLEHGKLDETLYVCHECDRPPCVNAAHLWQGTSLENTKDRIAKGRHYVFGRRYAKRQGSNIGEAA